MRLTRFEPSVETENRLQPRVRSRVGYVQIGERIDQVLQEPVD
jgi:hypothetical protein